MLLLLKCQRPERAYFISTMKATIKNIETEVCQRPERAYFISTSDSSVILRVSITGVNALNGLTSFLRCN